MLSRPHNCSGEVSGSSRALLLLLLLVLQQYLLLQLMLQLWLLQL
jgi:hypothetical protein